MRTADALVTWGLLVLILSHLEKIEWLAAVWAVAGTTSLILGAVLLLTGWRR